MIPASAKTRQMRAWAWTFMAAFGLITLASTWEGLLFMLGLAAAIVGLYLAAMLTCFALVLAHEGVVAIEKRLRHRLNTLNPFRRNA